MMRNMSLEQFKLNVEKVILDAANDIDFTKVSTDKGNAIIISEGEWKILVDALRILINNQK